MDFEPRLIEHSDRALVDVLDLAGWLSHLAASNLLSPLAPTQSSHLEVAAYLNYIASLLRDSEKAFFDESPEDLEQGL